MFDSRRHEASMPPPVQALLGAAVRCSFEDIVEAPLPARIATLLERLAAADQAGSPPPAPGKDAITNLAGIARRQLTPDS